LPLIKLKILPGTNGLAYCEKSYLTSVRSLIKLATDVILVKIFSVYTTWSTIWFSSKIGLVHILPLLGKVWFEALYTFSEHYINFPVNYAWRLIYLKENGERNRHSSFFLEEKAKFSGWNEITLHQFSSYLTDFANSELKMVVHYNR
jgi:hypothetical protein